MGYKYLHLIQRRKFIQNLRNLIGDREGHRIVIYGDESSDTDGAPVPRSEVLKMAEACKILFVHFLDYHKARLINNLDPSKKIVWFFWGGDGYHLGKFYNRFLLPKTRKLRLKLNVKNFLRGGWKELIKMSIGPLTDLIPPNYQVLRAIGNVDFIVPIVPQDYRNLKGKYRISAGMHHLNYINDVFISQPDINPAQNSRNILLGNSARYSNNHVEFIDRLESMQLEDRKVIIPLGYGDRQYGDFVGNYAKNKLGDQARILDEFLPTDEYRNIFDTCETVVMNHRRQQALANIVIALWFEKTIYMRSESGLYQFLVDNNFRILKTGEFKVGKCLNPDEKAANKDLLKTVFAPERQRRRFGELLNKLNQL